MKKLKTVSDILKDVKEDVSIQTIKNFLHQIKKKKLLVNTPHDILSIQNISHNNKTFCGENSLLLLNP